MDRPKLEYTTLQTFCRWEVPQRFVKMVASYHNVSNLNNDSASFLSYECTHQLFMLIGYAKKIALQCKRTHLKGSDILAALKLCSYDHLYGHFRQMNYQIQTTNYSSTRLKGLMTYADKEFDLESFLSQPPIKLPRDIMIHGHWLSIHGVVPDVAENIPQKVSENVDELEKLEHNINSYIYNGQNQNIHTYNVISNGKDLKSNNTGLLNSSLHGSTVFSDKIPLMIERQLIYKDLTESCFGQNESKRKDALAIISTDQVMKEIVPHLACFIKETVKLNIQQPNLGILLNCVRMIKAVFDNTHLRSEFMQNHIHYFVPSLLNCILSRRICFKPEGENHWALRCFASKTLANICSQFQLSLPSLSIRVCNISKRTLECAQSISSSSCQYLIDDNQKIQDKDIDTNNVHIKDEEILNQDNDQFSHKDEEKNTNLNDNDDNTLSLSPSKININDIPFSSYYGAASLLFDMSPSIAKITTFPLFQKLGQLVEITLQSNNINHQLAKLEAEQLKDLLLKQAKYIIKNFSTTPDILDTYILDYGSYFGHILYNELVTIKTIKMNTTNNLPKSFVDPPPIDVKETPQSNVVDNNHVL